MWRAFLPMMLLSGCSEADRSAGPEAHAGQGDADGVADVDPGEAAAADEARDGAAIEAEQGPDGVVQIVDGAAPEAAADTGGPAETAIEWRWEEGPSLPAVVQENAVLAVPGPGGASLWVMGGFQNLQIVDRVRVLALDAGAWSDGPTLPKPLHHMNAAVVDEMVYVLGSLEGFGFSATAEAWRMAPGHDPRWIPVSPMPAARRRGSAGVAVVGPDVYIVGGFRSGAVADADVFSTRAAAGAGAWAAIASLPGPRDHGVAVALGGKVYFVGGRDSDIGAVRSDLWVYDPGVAAAGWVALAPLPTARGGIAAAVYDGLIIVAGGEGNPAHASGVFPQVEAYDPATDAWRVLPPMRTPRHGTGAVALAGALWVPGGADVQAFGATDVVERLVHEVGVDREPERAQ